MSRYFVLTIALAGALIFSSCNQKTWKPGMPLAKEEVKVGVVCVTDPFLENAGYSYAHKQGIEEMRRKLGLENSQILYKIQVDDVSPFNAESAMRELIAQGANIIFATSWGYMNDCEKLSQEFPAVVFAHASGYKYNDVNFTNYFGKVYQARYLSGIIAGAQTKSGKIGFVAAWGTNSSEVTGSINAFALGVEKVNPLAKVYVKVTHGWFDPMGEASMARALIAEGCDVIAQHCDTLYPQREAARARVMGIGYNTDMSANVPDAVLCSVIWRWGRYYTALVQSVIDGSFTTKPWYGSLEDGIVDISPLNGMVVWEPEILRLLAHERQRLESGAFDVFEGIMETNDGRKTGKEGEGFPDDEIRYGIDWYYRTVIEL